MLVRLMYASRAAKPLDPEELSAILRQSKAGNPAAGITGVLCQGGDVFMQVLLNPALLLKYSESATLDPYAVSGLATAALFDELVATAAVMCQN